MANTAKSKSPTFFSTSRKYSASYSESSSHSQGWPASRDWSPMLWQARWWALCTCSSFWEQMRRWLRLRTCLRIISWTDSSHFCWAGSSRIISSTIDHSASLLYTFCNVNGRQSYLAWIWRKIFVRFLLYVEIFRYFFYDLVLNMWEIESIIYKTC